MVNINPNDPAEITLALAGLEQGTLSGRLLTAERLDSVNSYDAPETVRPVPFEAASWTGGRLHVEMPAKSIVVLTLRR